MRLPSNKSDLDNSYGRIRVKPAHERKGHVVDGDAVRGLALRSPVVHVTVEHRVDGEPVQRLLEPAAAEVRIDLHRLAVARLANGRVVQHGDAPVGPEPRERRLELERLVDGFLDELLDRGLSPRTEGAAAEATDESLGSRKADPEHFDGVAVEQLHAGLDKDASDRVFGAALVVVVAQNANHRDAHDRQLLREHARLVFEPVVRQVAAEQEHVCRSVRLSEQWRELTAGRLATVEIPDGSDAHGHASADARAAPGAWPRQGTPVASENGGSLGPKVVIEPTGAEPPSYARGLHALNESGVPFLVGGAVAIAAYCGIHRNTKDLDLFVRERDAPRVLDVLSGVGFHPEATFPHWLSKAHAEGYFIDVIFNSGNGEVPVDAEWFENAVPAAVFGVPAIICPPEETIWSKAFVMERERFDGADVAHLLLSCGATLDWHRLLRRFAGHSRVLFAHLILFGYVFPGATDVIPRWVMDELSARVQADVSADARMCRGTMLSREQYLPDLTRGWRDARLPPTGSMSREAIALWTDAIERH